MPAAQAGFGRQLFLGQVFSDAQWARQRSWRRYLPEFVNLARALVWYWPVLAAISLVSVFVCLYSRFAQPAGAANITEGDFTGPFRAIVFAISLMLQFECQVCYDRWLEGQSAFGAILHIARNLVLVQAGAASAGQRVLQQGRAGDFSAWAAMLPFALRAHLSGATADATAWDDCRDLLAARQLAWLGAQPSAPHAATDVLASLLAAGEDPRESPRGTPGGPDYPAGDPGAASSSSGAESGWPVEQGCSGSGGPGAGLDPGQDPQGEARAIWLGRLMGELHRYEAVAATSQRLYTSPAPPAYYRQCGRFVATWTLLFPFALFTDFWWATPLVSLVVGFLLSAVETISVQVEQPFAVYPMQAVSLVVKRSILNMRDGGLAAAALVARKAAALQGPGEAGSSEGRQPPQP